MNANRFRALNSMIDASARSPDQRICQLIFNALDRKGLARWPSGEPNDIFYIEDEVLANALEEYNP